MLYRVKSCIDNRPLDGIYSIRVHNGVDYSGKCRFIRWTEVFVIQVCNYISLVSNNYLTIIKLNHSSIKKTKGKLIKHIFHSFFLNTVNLFPIKGPYNSKKQVDLKL